MQIGTYQEKVSKKIGGKNLLQTIWVEEVLLSEEALCGGKHVHNIPAVRGHHYTEAQDDRGAENILGIMTCEWGKGVEFYLENRPLKNALTFTWGFGIIPAFRYRKSILLYLQKKTKQNNVGSLQS